MHDGHLPGYSGRLTLNSIDSIEGAAGKCVCRGALHTWSVPLNGIDLFIKMGYNNLLKQFIKLMRML